MEVYLSYDPSSKRFGTTSDVNKGVFLTYKKIGMFGKYKCEEEYMNYYIKRLFNYAVLSRVEEGEEITPSYTIVPEFGQMDDFVVRRCRSCGCYFTMCQSEWNWYVSKQLVPTKLCPECRAKYGKNKQLS